MHLVLGFFLQNFLTISGDLEREYQLLGWQKITLHSSCKISVCHSLCSRATRGVAVQNIHLLVLLTTGKMVMQIFWKTVVVKWSITGKVYSSKKAFCQDGICVTYYEKKVFIVIFLWYWNMRWCIVYIHLYAHVILNFLLIFKIQSIEIEMYVQMFSFTLFSLYICNMWNKFLCGFLVVRL